MGKNQENQASQAKIGNILFLFSKNQVFFSNKKAHISPKILRS